MIPSPPAKASLARIARFESHGLGAIKHVIVDRDGVLNEELGGGAHLSDPDRFQWVPGALNALADLRTLGVRVSVATNQSGIGRGLVSELELDAVHRKMTFDANVAHASIDAIYYCPHAPDAQCACRKPAPGLILAAITQSGISAANTLVIGDASRDLEAARSAGTHAVLVRTGKGRMHESYAVAHGIAVYDDLGAFVAELAIKCDRPQDDMQSLQAVFAEHARVVADAAAQILPVLSHCIGVARQCLRAGHKILACGNGGSAADAQHFVAELVGRYNHSRAPLSAIVLGSDSATLTAVSNDFGFDQVFARQVDALARRGDVLIALSTSGNSRNVINAAIAARERGCTVISLTGHNGGGLAQHADLALRVPSDTVARIQEVHELCLHALAQAIDSAAVESSTR
jgi:phosphoheptose isomerase